MTDHTPGPWVVDAIGQIFLAGIGPQPRICFVNGPAGKQAWEITVTEAEKAANARLIAAAPDLLEALKGMCLGSEAMETALWGDYPDEQMGTTYFKLGALRKARAAIKKATSP
jgi:hypothetical protein